MKAILENKKLLLWIVIILLVANLSAMISVIITVRNNKTGPFPGMKQIPKEFRGRCLYDNLDLNEQQKQNFDKIRMGYMTDMKEMRNEMQNVRQQMIREITAEKPDENKLDSLADFYGVLHARNKKMSYHHYMEIKEECNPEQRQKLNGIIEKFLDDDGPGPGGHHHGMRHHMDK